MKTKLFYFEEDAFRAAKEYAAKIGGRVLDLTEHVKFDRAAYADNNPEEASRGDFRAFRVLEYPALSAFDKVHIKAQGRELPASRDALFGSCDFIETLSDLGKYHAVKGLAAGEINAAVARICAEHGWHYLTATGLKFKGLCIAYDPDNKETLAYDGDLGFVLLLGKPELREPAAAATPTPEEMKTFEDFEFKL